MQVSNSLSHRGQFGIVRSQERGLCQEVAGFPGMVELEQRDRQIARETRFAGTKSNRLPEWGNCQSWCPCMQQAAARQIQPVGSTTGGQYEFLQGALCRRPVSAVELDAGGQFQRRQQYFRTGIQLTCASQLCQCPFGASGQILLTTRLHGCHCTR